MVPLALYDHKTNKQFIVVFFNQHQQYLSVIYWILSLYKFFWFTLFLLPYTIPFPLRFKLASNPRFWMTNISPLNFHTLNLFVLNSNPNTAKNYLNHNRIISNIKWTRNTVKIHSMLVSDVLLNIKYLKLNFQKIVFHPLWKMEKKSKFVIIYWYFKFSFGLFVYFIKNRILFFLKIWFSWV